jgi:hypothetical protein
MLKLVLLLLNNFLDYIILLRVHNNIIGEWVGSGVCKWVGWVYGWGPWVGVGMGGFIIYS